MRRTLFIPSYKGEINESILDRAPRTVWEQILHGSECIFVQLTKTKAAKLYPLKDSAEFALIQQMSAELINAAPKTYSNDISLFSFHYKVFYGYITQVAKQMSPELFEVHRSKLESYEEMLGFGGDLDASNSGMLGNKPVLIDFGLYSSDVTKERVLADYSNRLSSTQFYKTIEDIIDAN